MEKWKEHTDKIRLHSYIKQLTQQSVGTLENLTVA